MDRYLNDNICQLLNGYLNYNYKYEKNRFCVQIKLYGLFDYILEYKNNLLIKKCQNFNPSAKNVAQKNSWIITSYYYTKYGAGDGNLTRL